MTRKGIIISSIGLVGLLLFVFVLTQIKTGKLAEHEWVQLETKVKALNSFITYSSRELG